ncbi:MAG: hypothetical protein M0Z30_18420, partial [Actinomycetota bacterium]|nr:hypothetical protein [Actinomycetota bacterium]
MVAPRRSHPRRLGGATPAGSAEPPPPARRSHPRRLGGATPAGSAEPPEAETVGGGGGWGGATPAGPGDQTAGVVPGVVPVPV